MTVSAAVYNSANTGAAIASTDLTSGGYDHGLLDAAVSDPLNADAEIKIAVHRDHPSASAFTVGRVVRISDDNGEVVKFTIREVDDQKIDDDPRREMVTVTGRTLLAEWRDYLLRPHSDLGDAKALAYNFAYPGLDDSGWNDAVVEVDRSALYGFGRPIGWPDPYTAGVWSSTQAAGSLFARFTKALPAGRYVFYVAADDGFRVWVNGSRFASAEASDSDDLPFWWWMWRAFVVDLPAGTYTIGIEAINASTATPGTVWFGLWPVDAFRLGAGGPVTLSGPSSNPDPILAGWKWKHYPATRPAPPVTRIVHDFLARCHADSVLSDWTLGFANTQDSNGVAAPASEWLMDLDRTGFDMLQSLVTAGWLDFRVRKGAGKVLDAFIAPMGADTGLTHADADVGSLRTKVGL